jgi:hypothetical protein
MSLTPFIVPFSVKDDTPKSTVILLSHMTISDAIDKILEYAYPPKPVIPPSLLTEIQTFDDLYCLLRVDTRDEIENQIKQDHPQYRYPWRSRKHLLGIMNIPKGSSKPRYGRFQFPQPKCGYRIGKVGFYDSTGTFTDGEPIPPLVYKEGAWMMYWLFVLSYTLLCVYILFSF